MRDDFKCDKCSRSPVALWWYKLKDEWWCSNCMTTTGEKFNWGDYEMEDREESSEVASVAND